MNYQPDQLSPPGATVRDCMTERCISKLAMADSLNLASEDLEKLLDGDLPLTEEIAEKLAIGVGANAKFWLRREATYRRLAAEAAAAQGLIEHLPVEELKRWGWLPADYSEDYRAVLSFFGVKTVADWYREYGDIVERSLLKHTSAVASRSEVVAVWIRFAELAAEQLPVSTWDPGGLRDDIELLRALTRKKKPSKFMPELQSLCAARGLAVVVARPPPGCRATGATVRRPGERPTIALSLRYKTDDHFWFAFFHELGHVLLHDDLPLLLEFEEPGGLDDLERQANDFAYNTIIPPDSQAMFGAIRLETRTVIRFAMDIGVGAGLVVGQLQRQGRIPYHWMNGAKVRYEWDKFNQPTRRRRR